MPMGMPCAVCASLVLLSSRKGCTKLSTTTFTDGVPSPRSISQWFLLSNSVTLRTADQVQKSLPQCQAPYTETGVAPAAAGPAKSAAIPSQAFEVRIAAPFSDLSGYFDCRSSA